MTDKYDDIINLPHHVSTSRLQMSIENRAAQFSPFAALTGYEGAIEETKRQTDKRIELDENAIAILDMKLQMLADRIDEQPKASITYFVADDNKEGGKYSTITERIKKIDRYERVIILVNGGIIMIDDVFDID